MSYFEGCVTPYEVKQRWKRLSQLHHPDKGGDVTTFHEVKEAYDKAMKKAITPIKCPNCNGTGKRSMSSGFNSVQICCEICKGTGRINR